MAPTNRLVLHFSEPLQIRFSGGDLVMTATPIRAPMTSMAAAPRPLAVAAAPGDPETLVLTAQTALAPGAYRLNWHAVATDTHRVQGAFTFTVQ